MLSNKKLMTIKKISIGNLYDKIWSCDRYQLVEEYKSSFAQIRSVCNQYQIPRPSPVYCARKRYGMDVKIPDLPRHLDPNQLIEIHRNAKSVVSDRERLIQEIEEDTTLDLVVPDKLTKKHEFISSALATRVRRKKSEWYERVEGPDVSISVTNKQERRAFRLFNALFRLLEKRGHSISKKYNDTTVVIRSIEFPIRILERSIRVESGDSWGSTKLEPTGLFNFQYDDSFRRKEIKEGNIPLEERLAYIIATLELHVQQEEEEQIERKEYWRLNDLEKERLRQIEERKTELIEGYRELMVMAQRYNSTSIARNFLHEVGSKYLDDSNIKEYLQLLDFYDPQSSRKHELLDESDRQRLDKINGISS